MKHNYLNFSHNGIKTNKKREFPAIAGRGGFRGFLR